MADSSLLPPAELAERKDALRRRHHQQLVDFDALTAQLISRAEKELAPQAEVDQMNARLQLKEKQLRELADAMRNLSPEEALALQYDEQARRAAEEARRYNEDIARKVHEEMEKAKAEKLRKEEEKKRNMEKQFAYVIWLVLVVCDI